MPSLNELLESREKMIWDPKTRRKIMVSENNIKKTVMAKVVLEARMAEFFAPEGGYWTYCFVEPDRRRDPLNILAGAVKCIEDALVKAEMAPGDGWASVYGIQPHFIHNPEKPGVLVIWDRHGGVLRGEALEMLDEYAKA